MGYPTRSALGEPLSPCSDQFFSNYVIASDGVYVVSNIHKSAFGITPFFDVGIKQ